MNSCMRNGKSIVDKVAYWTGAQRPLIKRLIEVIEERIDKLGLFADTDRESEQSIQITVYVTALAMNYMARGKFAASMIVDQGFCAPRTTMKNYDLVRGWRLQ